MKKLSLLVAMLFVVGMAMAQVVTNTSETEQVGNENDVLVKQIGDQNEAESHQYGNENDASVLQTGDENVGIADQLRGDRNSADVKQEGNLNEGYIQQGLTSDYYDGYVPAYSEVAPTGYNMYANDNGAIVTQIGSENFSSVGQWGNNNTGYSVQEGNNNDVYIYQGWEGTWWGGPALYATNSKVDIKQYQNGNSARVWQYGGDNNTTNVSQDGMSNLVSVTQGWIYTDLNYDFTAPVLNTKNNFVSIDQLGNNNKAKMMQLGDNNSFKLNQTGEGNAVGYFDGSLQPARNAYFAQDGNNNRFAGVVLNASNTPSFRAGLDAEQFNGATLSYESYQNGNYNDIGLRQGKDDIALIQQDGFSNAALLWQQGVDQNDATMLQFGNNNSASVVQIQQ